MFIINIQKIKVNKTSDADVKNYHQTSKMHECWCDQSLWDITRYSTEEILLRRYKDTLDCGCKCHEQPPHIPSWPVPISVTELTSWPPASVSGKWHAICPLSACMLGQANTHANSPSLHTLLMPKICKSSWYNLVCGSEKTTKPKILIIKWKLFLRALGRFSVQNPYTVRLTPQFPSFKMFKKFFMSSLTMGSRWFDFIMALSLYLSCYVIWCIGRKPGPFPVVPLFCLD